PITTTRASDFMEISCIDEGFVPSLADCREWPQSPSLVKTSQPKRKWPRERSRGHLENGNDLLDRVLDFLCGAEAELLRRLDLDLLAGRRVAAEAGGALLDLEDAEAGHPDLVALLEVLHREIDEGIQELAHRLLRHFMLLGEFARDLRQRDRQDFFVS